MNMWLGCEGQLGKRSNINCQLHYSCELARIKDETVRRHSVSSSEASTMNSRVLFTSQRGHGQSQESGRKVLPDFDLKNFAKVKDFFLV